MNKSNVNDHFRSPVEDSFLTAPTKTVVIIFVLLWLIGSSLQVIAMTDLFREPLFQRRYFMSYVLLIGSTLVTVWICIAYIRKKFKQGKSGAGS